MPIKLLKIISAVFVMSIVALAVYVPSHHILVKVERGKLVPPGRMVEVNGHQLHVYAMGKKEG